MLGLWVGGWVPVSVVEKMRAEQRVYAYLGEERTLVKEWLAGVLWHDLMYNTGGLAWGGKYQALIGQVRESGISVREWMDGRLEENRASDSTDSLEG